MLGTVRDETGGQWAVLVLDAMTTKVMSSVAGISDIMDFSISRELFEWQARRTTMLGGMPAGACC